MGTEAPAGGGRPARVDLRYTKTRRREFLRVLAETYNPDRACAAARLTWPDICELRSLYPDFAARFDEVIAAGYDRLEAMLLRLSGIGGDGKPDLALAQALLKQRRAMKSGAPPGRPVPIRERAAMIKTLLDGMGLPSPAAGRRADGAGSGGGAGAARGGRATGRRSSPTGRGPTPIQARIRRNCGGRSIISRGATSSPSGATRTRPGTI